MQILPFFQALFLYAESGFASVILEISESKKPEDGKLPFLKFLKMMCYDRDMST